MDIIMPKMGESVSEGTIIKWHKKPGDSVKRDEIIFEISTDKVDTEIPSPAEGVLNEVLVNEGDTVPVGTVVARVGESGSSETPEKKENKETPAAVSEKSVETSRVEQVSAMMENVPETSSKGKVVSADSGSGLVDVAMPKMGESVMEGTIIKWHKKIGDKIKKDETIFEISTDKVDTEVPSPIEGVLAEIMVAEQETVDVGTVVAKISSGEAPAKTSAEKSVEKPIAAVQEPNEQMHENFAKFQKPVEEEFSREDTGFLSPLVLNIIRKENVSFDELKKIKGTGLDGRISKKDILGYIENRGSKPTAQAVAAQAPKTQAAIKENAKADIPVAVRSEESPYYGSSAKTASVSSGDAEIIPMDNVRQKIMQHMVNSRDTSVHVNTLIEVDMTKIYNFIQSNKQKFLERDGVKLTYMPFIAYAVVKALKEFPLVNSSIDGNNILQKRFINLGIAVSMEPNGLIVPNIKAAGDKNFIGLAKSIADIANRARNKKLTPDDIMNGTFTITNYGVFGAIFGTPIINQPEVAILGVGAVIKKPVAVEFEGSDTIAIKPIMALTLAHDHRLVDGMLGGKFIKFVKDTLESFDLNL